MRNETVFARQKRPRGLFGTSSSMPTGVTRWHSSVGCRHTATVECCYKVKELLSTCLSQSALASYIVWHAFVESKGPSFEEPMRPAVRSETAEPREYRLYEASQGKHNQPLSEAQSLARHGFCCAYGIHVAINI